MFIQLLGTVSIYLDLNSVQNFQLKCLSFFFFSFSLDLFCWWISDGKCWNLVWTVNFKYDCVSDIFWVYLIQLAQNIWIFSVVFLLMFWNQWNASKWTLNITELLHGPLDAHIYIYVCSFGHMLNTLVYITILESLIRIREY